MALSLKDRVRESSSTTGTGTVTLAGAYVGFQTFASAISDGDTVYYTIHNTAPGYETEWEVGLGTFTLSGTTLSRDTILSSSNAGSAVNFNAGTKEVFITYPSEAAVFEDNSGNVTVGGKLTVGTGPSADLDVATKGYVDNAVAAALHYHDPVRVESPDTTGNLNATYNNGTAGVGATLTNAGTQAALVIDGITLNVADRVLIYQQADATQNGVYTVTDVGSGSTNWVLTRATDADSYNPSDPDAMGQGDAFYVQEGNTGAGESYVLTTQGTITFGTTNITYSQFSATPQYTGTGNIDVTGQVISLTGTVGETNGGTGTNTYALGDVLYSNASDSLAKLAGNTTTTVKYLTQTGTGSASAAPTWTALAASATTDTTDASNISSGTLSSARISGSYTGITGVGTLTAGTWNAGTIGAAYGGTGLTSYTIGDIVYATGSTTIGKLADIATGNVLLSGGVGVAPQYGKVGLTTHVSGVLPIANGGTNSSTATGAFDALAPTQTGNSGKYLTTDGATTSWAAVPAPNNGTLTMAVSGTGLSGSASFTADQSGNSTFTVTSNATNANTASTVVARDASGNFSAGTITASLSGNATTATTASATAATLTRGSYLTGSNFNGSSATTWAVDATNLNTASKVVARDASGNFSAGTITAALSGNATTATTLQTARTIGGVSFNGSANINLPGVNTAGNQNTSGNAASATVLQTARTIGGVSFNGSADINLPGVNTAGNQNTSGNAATATYATSAGNADTTDGYHVSTTRDAANTIPVRDGSGYLQLGWINTTSGDNGTTAIDRVYASSDGYIRYYTPANFRTVLDVPTRGGSGASGTWGINVTGSSASCTGNAATATTASNTTSISSAVGGGYTWTGTQYFRSNQNTTGSAPPLQAYSDNASGAIMSFHRGGYYAVNMGLDSDNVFRIGGWSASANLLQMDMSGNLTMAGNVTAYSDERLKKDWKEVQPDFIEQLSKVKSGTYTRIDNEERQAGVSAQSLQTVLPETVITDADGTLAVAYGNAALVSTIELAKRVVEQEARIAALESAIKALKGE